MPINIYELEGRASAVAGGVFISKAFYEGLVSFGQSMTSIDPLLYRPHVDATCLYGLLFFTAIGGIIHASSHSNHMMAHQPTQDYPNVNA